MSDILELYGVEVAKQDNRWQITIENQYCPFLDRQCVKTRKSNPDITIGSCSVDYGKARKKIMICPHRLLERKQVFFDCLHLLTLHEPGNELHIISEVAIPGGTVDYFLVSVHSGKVVDFAGIELQTLDTTGTIWAKRQTFLQSKNAIPKTDNLDTKKSFGMNWKMTAKTILVQLNHKIHTFENINKHLVLVIQDHLLDYMQGAFQFDNWQSARLGDAMHLHAYEMSNNKQGWRIQLQNRLSTDANGIAKSLGLQANPHVALEAIIKTLENKLSSATQLTIP